MFNYEQVKDALYYRESFMHGSCHAERTSGATFYDLDTRYRVWSYTTLVLDYDLVSHVVTYFDNRHYSNTTSRLQNMIRDNLGMGGTDYDARIIYQ